MSQSDNAWITNGIKLDAVDKWVASDSTQLGRKPTVKNVDGHGSNTEQEALCALYRNNGALVFGTVAHATAECLQQADRSHGIIQRCKKEFRRAMRKQFNASLKPDVPPNERGRLKMSVILRLLQVSALKAHDGDANLRDNRRVGYYVNEETGRLDYDPLKVINAARFVSGDAQDERLQVRNEVQQRVDAALIRAQAEVAAATGALFEVDRPPVELAQPLLPVPRGGRKSRNAAGCCISSVDFEATLRDERLEKEREAKEKADRQTNRECNFARSWGPQIKEAQEALNAAHGELSGLLVKHLKALIVSKTGKGAKANNNKEHALLNELRGLIDGPTIFLGDPTATVSPNGNTQDDGDPETGSGDDEADYGGEIIYDTL